MSSIEKIRQEIERRITDNTFGAKLELIDLLAFIDSLPECEETAKIPTEKYEEELNEEIQGFIDEYGYERGEDKILIAIVARHFAEWQKEQMMKDAVEGFIFQSEDYYPKELVAQYNGELKHGDKVKIIIVKQDDRPRD